MEFSAEIVHTVEISHTFHLLIYTNKSQTSTLLDIIPLSLENQVALRTKINVTLRVLSLFVFKSLVVGIKPQFIWDH